MLKSVDCTFLQKVLLVKRRREEVTKGEAEMSEGSEEAIVLLWG